MNIDDNRFEMLLAAGRFRQLSAMKNQLSLEQRERLDLAEREAIAKLSTEELLDELDRRRDELDRRRNQKL
jgi:hypothetical protein